MDSGGYDHRFRSFVIASLNANAQSAAQLISFEEGTRTALPIACEISLYVTTKSTGVTSNKSLVNRWPGAVY